MATQETARRRRERNTGRRREPGDDTGLRGAQLSVQGSGGVSRRPRAEDSSEGTGGLLRISSNRRRRACCSRSLLKNAVVGTNTGSGVGHGSRDDQAELEPEERWLRLWAYATSPYGLGLQSDQFWGTSVRELHALKEVHRASLTRWALERSMFMNAHFVRGDDERWTPEDFLGEGNRKERMETRFLSTMAAQQANIALLKIRKGQAPDDSIPVWAR